MNDLPNPFAYEPLPEDDEPLPEQYFNVTADKAQWLNRVIELQILEMQRQGMFVDENLVRQVNSLYADHTQILALEPTGIFEHRAFEVAQYETGLSLDDISAYWKKAAEQGKRVVLYQILPKYEGNGNIVQMNTAPTHIGYIVKLAYVV